MNTIGPEKAKEFSMGLSTILNLMIIFLVFIANVDKNRTKC
jgi:hypothetical protein